MYDDVMCDALPPSLRPVLHPSVMASPSTTRPSDMHAGTAPAAATTALLLGRCATAALPLSPRALAVATRVAAAAAIAAGAGAMAAAAGDLVVVAATVVEGAATASVPGTGEFVSKARPIQGLI